MSCRAVQSLLLEGCLGLEGCICWGISLPYSLRHNCTVLSNQESLAFDNKGWTQPQPQGSGELHATFSV